MPEIRIDDRHRYWLGEHRVPGFTEICVNLGVMRPNPHYTEQGRREGVALHEWLGFLVRGRRSAEPPHPSIAGRVRGIQKFIKDTGFKIAGGETPLYDPVGRFACTPDLWGHIGSLSWVIDAKRGSKLPTHALQTATQRIALAANGFRAQKRGALYLRDNDYRLDEHANHVNENHWRAITAGYHAMTPEQRTAFAADDVDIDSLGLPEGYKRIAVVSAYNARRKYT